MATVRQTRRMDPYAAQFWEFARNKEFRLQQCQACGKFRWPPAPVCDRCLSEAFAWTPAAGRGTLLSWVVFHRQYFPEYPPPHLVAIVELEEGPLFITGPVAVTGPELRDGLPMVLTWLDAQDQFGEYFLPAFRPAGSPAGVA